MKRINQIVQSPTTPNTPDVLWINTADPDNPVLSALVNGEFKPIGGGTSKEETTIPENGAKPDVVYNLNQYGGTISFDTSKNENGHYFITFFVYEDSDIPTLDLSSFSGFMWYNDEAPEFSTQHYYEISILNQVGMFAEHEIVVI